MNKFEWGHTRRYNAAANAIKIRYGSRIQKLTIDAGFTCPNRDGSKSTGGCTFCNNQAFNPSYCEPNKPIRKQIAEGIRFHEKRYKKATKYMAYFQAYSNTYANLDVLRQRYFEALENENVIGLIIGTRPDCITPEIVELLSEIHSNHELRIEFGIESVYDKTLKEINRGHTFKETIEAFELCSKNGLECGGHIILGLPGENREMIIDSANILSSLPLANLKLHQLHYVKDSLLGKEFLKAPAKFKQFSLDEYIDVVIAFLEKLKPQIVIERLAGETRPNLNLGTTWGIRYDKVLQRIEKELEQRDTWQGKRYKPQNTPAL